MNEQNNKRTIKRYIGGESYVINAKLRDGEPLTTNEAVFVSELNNALDNMPIFEGGLYRSITLDESDIRNFINLHQIGQEVTYPAFTSFSKDVYDENFNIQIYAESKNGRDISMINTGENEVLYKTNLKFKVLDLFEKNNTIYVRLEDLNK